MDHYLSGDVQSQCLHLSGGQNPFVGSRRAHQQRDKKHFGDYLQQFCHLVAVWRAHTDCKVRA